MNKHALLHVPESRYCFPLNKSEVVIRLRTSKNDDLKISLIYGMKYKYQHEQKTVEIPLKYTDSLFNYYEIKLTIDDVRLVYVFLIEEDGKQYYFSEDGVTEEYNFEQAFYNCFQLPYINSNDVMDTVDWMPSTVFYQIFVDRFATGNSKKDMSYIDMKWGDKPTIKGHAGGDLKGITNHLSYLKDLGISGIYLTPIFQSKSNHKYDIIDYKKIDKSFGTTEDLVELVKKAHSLGIKIVLDAVFNHCSSEMEQFIDVRKHGRDSKYYSWFLIDGDAPEPSKGNYECFASCDYMPKLNTANFQVQDFLIDIATYWIDVADIDGWRLDVADEVSHDFWRLFRKAVKKKKPNSIIIGENWHDAYPSLMGEQQDSIMNYAFTKSCLDYFARDRYDAKQMAEKLNGNLMRNMEQVNNMMLNLLDSHDTLRFLTELNSNKKRLKCAIALTMMMPGTPCLFYGTEIGLEGGYDPDCRRCFNWDQTEWDMKLWNEVKQLISIKKNQDALHFPEVKISEEKKLLKVERSHENEKLTMYINMTDKPVELQINGNQILAGSISENNLEPEAYVIIKG